MEGIKKNNLDNPGFKRNAIYNDGDLAITDKLNEFDIPEEASSIGFYALILCLQGKASININGNSYVAHENDILICPPDVILSNVLLSIDFKCYCIGISTNYILRILPIVDSSWDVKILFEKDPLFSLKTKEIAVFCQYYKLLHEKVSRDFDTHQREVIDALVQAFIYEFRDTMNKCTSNILHSFTSSERIFKTFIDLLSSSYPKNRNVSFYADKLYITPKYLSSVCKSVCVQTASKIIDLYVIKDIDYALIHTHKTIKEICNEMDFPNLSFFGKYVKKQLGMSPKVFREQIARQHLKNSYMNKNIIR